MINGKLLIKEFGWKPADPFVETHGGASLFMAICTICGDAPPCVSTAVVCSIFTVPLLHEKLKKLADIFEKENGLLIGLAVNDVPGEITVEHETMLFIMSNG